MRGYSVRNEKQFNALIRLNIETMLLCSRLDTHVLRLTDCNNRYLTIAGSTFGSGTVKNGKLQRTVFITMSPHIILS